MSVRAVTQSEQMLATGEPFSSAFALFGGLQGVLMACRTQHTTFRNMKFNAFAWMTILGMSGAGYALGFYGFGDAQMRRLVASHDLDRLTKTELNKFNPEE